MLVKVWNLSWFHGLPGLYWLKCESICHCTCAHINWTVLSRVGGSHTEWVTGLWTREDSTEFDNFFMSEIEYYRCIYRNASMIIVLMIRNAYSWNASVISMSSMTCLLCYPSLTAHQRHILFTSVSNPTIETCLSFTSLISMFPLYCFGILV
jgi:hypothetical protein